jgi:hypothetical protein
LKILRSCAALGAVMVVIVPSSLASNTPRAFAGCTETGGITMCQNVVRGANSGREEEALWYPYPCEYDYLCDDGASVFDNNDNDNNARPPAGNRPDNGLPGRPDRPNRPGGGR